MFLRNVSIKKKKKKKKQIPPFVRVLDVLSLWGPGTAHDPQQDKGKQDPALVSQLSRLPWRSPDCVTETSPFWFFSGLPHKSTGGYL